MRIIEKKCPNCGANLSFESNAKTTKCSYCNQSYIIEQDEKDDDNISPEHYKLQKAIFKTFSIMHLLITIVAIIIFVGIFVIAFKQIKSMGSFNDVFGIKDTKTNNIDINDIDEKTFKMIHNTSLEKLKIYNKLPINDYNKSDYEYLGSYLYEGKKGYVLCDIYKLIYSKDNKKIDIYESVTYENVKHNKNKITLDYNGRVDVHMTILNDSFVIGYTSIEDLYNKVIVSNATGDIQATNGLYTN